MGGRVSVGTFKDWNELEPGYLEIHLAAYGGGAVSADYIHSLSPSPSGQGL